MMTTEQIGELARRFKIVGLDVEQVDVESKEPQGKERLAAHRPLNKHGSTGPGAHPCEACSKPPEDPLIDESEEGKEPEAGGDSGRTGEPEPQPRLLGGKDQEDDDKIEKILVHAPAPGGMDRLGYDLIQKLPTAQV